MAARVVLFGDALGLPRLLRHVPRERVAGLVRAAPREGEAAALEALASKVGVPLLAQARGDAAFAADLRALEPDVLLVDSYSLRVPAVARGYNVHGSLLPRYRAANPLQWAMIEGEVETGVTIHELAPEIDAGAIVAQAAVPILVDDTWVQALARIGEAIEALLGRELPAILEGEATGTPQDPSQATSFPRRRPEDGQVDWSASVRRTYDLVRALVAPLPGARDGEEVLDRYLTLAEVAALKAERAAPEWGLRPRASASVHDPLVLDLVGGGTATLAAWDWQARTAVLDPWDERAARFARAELEVEPQHREGQTLFRKRRS